MAQSNSQAVSNGAAVGETLLEARMCSKTYETEGKLPKGASPHLVLDRVQVSIPSGEFVALLGPSGSGKSTLLRILAGLIQPTSGQVYFKGQPQYGPNPHVAIVFQSFALFPWLTVLQNVELGLESQPLTQTQRLKRAGRYRPDWPGRLRGRLSQRIVRRDAPARRFCARPGG